MHDTKRYFTHHNKWNSLLMLLWQSKTCNLYHKTAQYKETGFYFMILHIDSHTEAKNDLADIVEVAMRHGFLTDRLAQFVQQNMQLIFRR